MKRVEPSQTGSSHPVLLLALELHWRAPDPGSAHTLDEMLRRHPLRPTNRCESITPPVKSERRVSLIEEIRPLSRSIGHR